MYDVVRGDIAVAFEQELIVNPGFSEVLYIVRITPEEMVSRVQCSVQGSVVRKPK